MLAILSRLFFYGAMLCCLVSAALFAFNLSLSQNAVAARVSKIFSENIPHVEVNFTAAKLYWNWHGFAARVHDFSLKTNEHNTLRVPVIDFRVSASQLRVFMEKPTLTIRRTADNLQVALPVSDKDWLITAMGANIVFSDVATNISATLTMAEVLLRREKEQLHLHLSDNTAYGGIQIAADIKQSATKEWNGNLYLSAPQVPSLAIAAVTPLALQHLSQATWAMAAVTLWASFGDEVLLTTVGNAEKVAYQDVQTQALAWRSVTRRDKNDIIRLSVAAIANEIAFQEGQVSKLAWQGDGLWDSDINMTVAGVALGLTHNSGQAATVRWQAAFAAAALSVAFTVRAFDLLLPHHQENITATVDMLAQGTWRGFHDGIWSLTNGFIATSLHAAAAVLSARLALTGQNGTVNNIAANGWGNNIAITTVAQYMPTGNAREWMVSNLQEGVFNQLTFAVHNSLAALSDGLKGVSLKASFTNAQILIDDGWPQAKAVAGVLSLNNDTLRIVGEGVIEDIFISDVTAEISALTTPQPSTLWLDISATRTTIDDYLTALRAFPPIKETVKKLIANYSYTGNGALLLSLGVPLKNPQETEVHAVMALDEGQLSLLNEPLFSPLDIAAGTVFVDGEQIRGMLNGFWRHSPMMTFFSADAYTLTSAVYATTALELFGVTALCENCTGGKSDFRVSADAMQTVFFLPLNGVGITLPPPFGKALTDTVAFSIFFRDGHIGASYLNGDEQVHFLRQKGGIDIAINVPVTAPATNNKTNIYGTFSGLNIDALLSTHPGVIAAGAIDNSLGLGHISLTLKNLIFSGEQQSLFVLQSPSPTGAYRRVRLNTKPLSADVLVGDNFLTGDIHHINYSETIGGGFDWRHLTLALTVEQFFTDDTLWGRVLLQGSPGDKAWSLHTLVIGDSGNFLYASGTFMPSLAVLSVQVTMPSLAALLQSHDVTGFINAGNMSLGGNFFWQQAAGGEWPLKNLRGTIQVEGNDIHYEEGGADIFRFLSVLSPESLFNLGFTELGNPGVQSFKISGELIFTDAFILSDEILIAGEDVDIILKGKTDIQRRQHDLKGRVLPGLRIMSAGSAVSLGSTLAGATAFAPSAFFTAFFLGKIFEEPLSKIGAYDYTISGDWDDPVYTEISTTDKQQKDTDK